MPFETFPIVCWRLDSGSVLGIVVGNGISVVEADVKKLKKNAGEAIGRQIRDGYFIEAPDMDEAELHFHKVDVQLSYRDENGTYPLADTTEFRIAAVYGNLTDGSFGECYLPHFDESFYYYTLEQRTSLIKHFAREFLQDMSPEHASRYILPSEPWLERLRINTEAKAKRSNDRDETPKLLYEVADSLPIGKKIRRNLTRFPETAWERQAELALLAKVLNSSHENCLLVGEQGVGKSTILNEAIKIACRVPDREQPLTFWRTSCQRLVGKAKYLGEWQAICDDLVSALARVNGVLWITDFMALLHTGGESQEDSVAAYLQSYVSKGQLRILAEVRPQELEIARTQLPGFVHMFKQITVAELSGKQTRQVLDQLAHYAQQHFKLSIGSGALDLCFLLATRYLKYEKSPGNVVHFFFECVKARMKTPEKPLDSDFVMERFVAYTGLPELLLRDDLPLSDEVLEDFFKQRIVGQDHVLKELSSIIHMFKAGLNDPQRPIATLLLVGPTGVGKTAVTKALAEFFFSAGQKKHPLIALDMSEFQHPGQVSRLIGDRRNPGKLVAHIRQQPFSVVLFDEIEKAHPAIYDMLLAVLDEGILSDRTGRVTDFRSSIIVMTSNLGTAVGTRPGFLSIASDNDAINAVRQHFRPEFFNRIDLVLQFNSLDRGAIEKIVRRELTLLHQRDRIRQQKISLDFSDALVKFVADKGFSPEYGARPIQRAIEKHVVGALARYVLNNNTAEALLLDIENGDVVVR